jgi:hypothetical protein
MNVEQLQALVGCKILTVAAEGFDSDTPMLFECIVLVLDNGQSIRFEGGNDDLGPYVLASNVGSGVES